MEDTSPHPSREGADKMKNLEAGGSEDAPVASKELPPTQPHGYHQEYKPEKNENGDEQPAPPDLERQRSAAHASTASTKAPMPRGQEILFVLVVCCAQLFTQASMGQAIPILHYMSPTFGGLSAGEMSWIPAAFSLTTGTFIIVAGRTADMVGSKTVFVIGWVWCAIWALIAGLSALTANQIFFDVCRAMQGIGCAMLIPSALAILGSTYPAGPRKAMVFALFAVMAPNGFLIGAAFAGICAQLVWWPWAFWLMAICCAALAILSVFVVPGPVDSGSSIGPQSFDYLGAVTGVTGLVLFNVAWNQAPIVGWQTPYVIVLLILGTLFIGAFLFVEYRVAQPLIPVSGFHSDVGFVLGCVALGWASFGIWLYYYWQFLEVFRGDTPLLVTAQTSPAGIAGLIAGFATGKLLGRWYPEVIMMVAMVAFCLGNILVATMEPDQSYWAQSFLAAIITPFGMDMSFPAATLILSNAVPKRHQGIAASLVVTVVNYSISIGLGIGATVESRIDRDGVPTVHGFHAATYAGVGLSCCGIFLAVIFIVTNAMKRRHKTEQEVPPVDST